MSTAALNIVLNYFPSLRIMEYNITGLDTSLAWTSQMGKGKGVSVGTGWDADARPTVAQVEASYDEEERNV